MISIHYKFNTPRISATRAEALMIKLRAVAIAEPFYSVDPKVNWFGPDDTLRTDPIHRIEFRAWLTRKHAMNVSLSRFASHRGKESNWFSIQHVRIPNLADDLYLSRHLAVISVLDHAQKFGINLKVIDDAGYWEHRSAYKLMGIKRALEELTN